MDEAEAGEENAAETLEEIEGVSAVEEGSDPISTEERASEDVPVAGETQEEMTSETKQEQTDGEEGA